MTINELITATQDAKTRSAWSRGVKTYALELLENLEEAISGGYFSEEDLTSPKLLEKALLNGAADWSQYSWGGCSLIYNSTIALRLCTYTELVKTKDGSKKPNPYEEWLDVQARALYQASALILSLIR